MPFGRGDNGLKGDRARTEPGEDGGKGSGPVRVVELRGIEPLTSAVRLQRSTN